MAKKIGFVCLFVCFFRDLRSAGVPPANGVEARGRAGSFAYDLSGILAGRASLQQQHLWNLFGTEHDTVGIFEHLQPPRHLGRRGGTKNCVDHLSEHLSEHL